MYGNRTSLHLLGHCGVFCFGLSIPNTHDLRSSLLFSSCTYTIDLLGQCGVFCFLPKKYINRKDMFILISKNVEKI